MTTTILIALLISLGMIDSDSDYYNASPEQQENYLDIVIQDDLVRI